MAVDDHTKPDCNSARHVQAASPRTKPRILIIALGYTPIRTPATLLCNLLVLYFCIDSVDCESVVCILYIRRTGRLPAAPAAQHNPQQQPHTQTARMACCRAGPALSTQPQQRAHERRVSGVSIRLGMRAAPAVRQWPAGRLVKAPQQPLQAVGRRGGGGGGGGLRAGKARRIL